MRMKNKILFGFGCMFAVTAVISALVCQSLDEAAAGYDEYRRHTRMHMRLGDAPAGWNAAGAAMDVFPDGYDESSIKTARNVLDAMDKQLDAVIREMTDAQRPEKANTLRQQARVYKEGLDGALLAYMRVQELFRSRVLPNSAALEAGMALMARNARRSNDAGLLYLLTQMGSQIAEARVAMGQYLYSRADESGKTVTLKAAEARSVLEQMRASTHRTPQVFEAHGKLAAVFTAWAGGLAAVIEAGRAADAVLAEQRAIRTSLNREFVELRAAFDREVTIHGPTVNEAMTDGRKLLLGGLAAVLVIGVLAALLILSGLAGLARETSAFARALADGDFQARPPEGEHGASGELPEALRCLAAVLQSLLRDCEALEARIAGGEADAWGDAAAYRGGFAGMVAGVNAALERAMLRVAGEAGAISEGIAASSEELAARAEQIARGLEAQHGRVESADASVTEMRSAALETAGSAGRAAAQSEMARKKAVAGAALVKRVARAVNTVNTAAMALRTNLRAAGDVAGAVAGAAELVAASGRMLEEIVRMAGANSAAIASLAAAAEAQGAAVAGMHQAFEEINTLARDAADGMRLASPALQELSRTARNLQRVMAEMRHISGASLRPASAAPLSL